VDEYETLLTEYAIEKNDLYHEFQHLQASLLTEKVLVDVAHQKQERNR
jgi:hypothetical protein